MTTSCPFLPFPNKSNDWHQGNPRRRFPVAMSDDDESRVICLWVNSIIKELGERGREKERNSCRRLVDSFFFRVHRRFDDGSSTGNLG